MTIDAKKSIALATVAAAATGALAVTNAHAAMTPETTPAPQVNTDQTENALKAAQDQSRQDYQTAKQADDAAQATLKTAQAKDSSAQAELTSAKSAVTSTAAAASAAAKDQVAAKDAHDAAVKAAGEAKQDPQAVKAAQDQVAKASAAAQQSGTALKTAAAAQTAAQKALDAAKASAQNGNQAKASAGESIKTSQAWLDEVKKIVTGHDNLYQITGSDSALLQQLGAGLYENNKYQKNAALAKVALHFNADGTLNASDQLEATRFADQLINAVRQQLGTPQLKISQQSLEDGTKIAQGYGQANWNVFQDAGNGYVKGHNQQVLFANHIMGEAAHSPEYISTNGVDGPWVAQKLTNMDQLHENIFNALVDFLFKDAASNWGHMTDIVGTRGNDWAGVFSSVQYDKYGNLHFNSRPDWNSGEIRISGNVQGTTQKDGSEQYPVEATEASRPGVDSAAVKQAQEKLDAATTAYKQAQTNNDQAQTALKQAQDKLVLLTNATQAIKDTQAKLDTATKALTAVQDAAAKAKEALPAAQKKADAAAAALKDAQGKEALTAQALKTAQDKLITDAKLYGESVQLKPVAAIHAGEELPALEIANPMKADPTQDLLTAQFVKMASAPMETLPSGTTASWANPDQVKADAQAEGTYDEDVLVTFPDGSTTTVTASLPVLAALPKAAPTTDESSKSVAMHVENGKVVDAAGNVLTGYQLVNGQIVKGAATAMKAAMPAKGAAAKAATPKANQLPQTGDASQGPVALGLAGLMTMFGLAGVGLKKRA